MKKIKTFFILIATSLLFSTVLVLAENVNLVKEQCSNWDKYENCYNLGSGFTWCRYDKISFDKEVETEKQLIKNQKTLETIYLCHDGELVSKANIHYQSNSLESEGFIQTKIEKDFPSSPNNPELTSNILYNPNYILKILKGDLQFIKGQMPLF